MTVDFGKIKMQGLEGETLLDVRKELGNALYYQSEDLKGSELGKRIYFSIEAIEVKEEEAKLVVAMADRIYRGYVIKEAIKNALK